MVLGMGCGGADVGEDGDVGGGVGLCAGGDDGFGGGEAGWLVHYRFCYWFRYSFCCLLQLTIFSLISKQTTKPVSNTKSNCPVGFVHKGNRFYANSILQILSAVLNLWNRVPSE